MCYVHVYVLYMHAREGGRERESERVTIPRNEKH